MRRYQSVADGEHEHDSSVSSLSIIQDGDVDLELALPSPQRGGKSSRPTSARVTAGYRPKRISSARGTRLEALLGRALLCGQRAPAGA